MKNLKTTFQASKNSEIDTIFFQPYLPDVYFSPSSHRYLVGKFEEFVEQTNKLSLSSIGLIPVTVETSEEVINRQQYRGYKTYDHRPGVTETIISNPIVIRGKSLPEFTMKVLTHNGFNLWIASNYGDSLTDGQRKMLKDQLKDQLAPQITEDLLHTLKANAIAEGKESLLKHIKEQREGLVKLEEEATAFYTVK